jgi:tetratricopeptide (TPR) repeat protein
MKSAGAVWCVVGVACLGWIPSAAGAPPPAAAPFAQPASDGQVSEAKQHHAEGSKLYDLAEYEAALREFKEAYRAIGDPAFLFNIAQCHRKLGHAQDAITFYRNYLRRAPHAANRAEVERLIGELERTPAAPLPAEAPAAPAPPPAAPPAAPPAPALAPAPAAAGGEPALIAVPAGAPPPAPAETPFYKRGWFWIVTGAVVAGTATTLIVLHERSTSSPFCPDCAGTGAITP